MQTGRFTDDPAVADAESAYAAYCARYGAWSVGHHRGEVYRPEFGDIATQEAALVEARRDLASRLRAQNLDSLAPDDRLAVTTMRAALPDMDDWVPAFDGVVFDDGGDARLAEEPVAAGLRREVLDRFTETASHLEYDDERLHRLTLQDRLAREDDGDARRALFDALGPLWQIVDLDGGPDSPYRRLVRSAAARWAHDGSPIAANAAGLGIDPETVEPILRQMLRTFRDVALGSAAGSALASAAGSALGSALVEPWDYRYIVGALPRRLDSLLPRERLRPINDAHLAALGAAPADLGIEYDIFPRPGRPDLPVAFTFPLELPVRTAEGWQPARSWVFGTYQTGGLGNLEELLHESGHALQDSAVRARPGLAIAPPSHAAFWEAFADVLGHDPTEPAFLLHHLGVEVSAHDATLARYGHTMLDACWTLFEIELHRHPGRRPNDVWAETVEGELGIRGHPEWSWWATRSHLLDGPGYLANYVLGAVMVAAVRARIREVRGDWSRGDPGWYAFVSERLLHWSGAREPADILRDFLGGPLTADALLADLRSAG